MPEKDQSVRSNSRMESNSQWLWDALNQIFSKEWENFSKLERRGNLNAAELDFINRIRLIAELAATHGSSYIPDFLAGLPDLSPKPVGTYAFQRGKLRISNVASQLAAMELADSVRSGNIIEIPSLGITITREDL